MSRIEDAIQQKKFRNPYQKAVINLIYTSNWLQNKHQVFFKAFGITSQQFNILRVLKGQHPNSISAKDIRSRLLDQNSDVSRLLDRLIGKGLVTKTVCPTDKRAFNIFISQKGLDLLQSIDKQQNEIDGVLSLTQDEAEQLSHLLDKSRGT